MKPLPSLALIGFAVVLILGCSRDGAPQFDASLTAHPTSESDQAFIKARVLNVVDGLTIEVEIEGQIHRVRYLV